MERAVFFLDYANINRAANDKDIKLDYENLLHYIEEGRFLIDAYCYVPIDPRSEHQMDRNIDFLWNSGYLVTSKVGNISGNTYKCDFDVEMTIDILRICHTIRPDIVILGTGDIDFLPVVLELRKMGIRVEIACFEWAASKKLKLQGSDFIDLKIYYNDYLYSQENIGDPINEINMNEEISSNEEIISIENQD